MSSIWFANRYPTAQIYALEPDQSNFAALRHNISKYRNIVPIRGAIWDRRTSVQILNATAPAWARQVAELTPNGSEEIPAFSVADIMRMAGASRILIAKIDIEGSESELFRSSTEWMDITDLIVIELHDALAPGTGKSNAFLREVSLRRFDIMWHGETLFCFAHPPQCS